jgi:ArsR family transcriptional regulator, arsenate/arsenite/antimonite-responsive transcriptional repressor
MKTEAQLFKALADETRLQILWLLMGQEELCVCDIMGVLGITQSKASRHLRYLYNAGLVSDRREGLWMYYRISVAFGSRQGKQLQVLREILSSQPAARMLSQQLQQWLKKKSCRTQGTEQGVAEFPV